MYITCTKSGGYSYVYLRAYKCKQEMKSLRARREKDLFSFGRLDKALKNVEMWLRYPVTLPEELKSLGVNLNDLKAWKNKMLDEKKSFSKSSTNKRVKVI